MIVALAWPFVALCFLGAGVWLWSRFLLASSAAAALESAVAATWTELVKLHKEVESQDKYLTTARSDAHDMRADIAKLKAEMEKLTLGRALGRTG